MLRDLPEDVGPGAILEGVINHVKAFMLIHPEEDWQDDPLPNEKGEPFIYSSLQEQLRNLYIKSFMMSTLPEKF